MRLAVFGATGAAGREIVSQALALGHDVVAAVRHPEALAEVHPRLTVVAADVLDSSVGLAPVIANVDAVLSALGSRGRHPTTVYSEGTRRIAEAMDQDQLHRFISISSDGIDIPRGLPLAQRVVMRVVIQRLYRFQYTDMTGMEAFLDGSTLDWTVVRAPRLIDGPPTGGTRVSLNEPILDGGSLRRSDLARFMIDAVYQSATYRRRVHLASPRR